MSQTKRALERLWAGEPTPEDIAFAGGPEAAAAMRVDSEADVEDCVPEGTCQDCGRPSRHRLCDHCFVIVKC